MPRFVVLLGLLALVVLSTKPAGAGTLSHDIKVALEKPELSGAVTGVVVTDVKTGKVLFEQNAATHLMPASNRKLFTSAAALELLGDNFILKTQVMSASKPDTNGVINGDLYLKGGGDSLLSPDDLTAFAKSLVAQGVKRITGDVVGDGSIFKGSIYPDGWAVSYLSDYYAPQVTGLELSEGYVAISLTGGANAGDPVSVTLDPPTSYIPVHNDCVTRELGTPAKTDISRPFDQNIIEISGSVPVGYKAAKPDDLVTVMNPPLFAATVFLETLRKNGIEVDGQANTGPTPADSIVLAQHSSLPMAQYIRLMNKPSDNLLAESLVRVLGAVRGKSGDYDGGHAVEEAFFEKQMGVKPGDLALYDGCGVSRLDLVTPRAVVALLLHMAKEPDFKAYYDSLPIAGVDGTLAKRMRGTPAAGKVHAKTGFVTACRALSGYVTTRSGRMLAFSMIMNNYVAPTSQINKIQDAIAERLAEEK
jgi:D-alanyl-D-alanine carboxypeptidase/D-alanyl-D-alanine-endopeptidase (penicillin-binding protein 4)